AASTHPGEEELILKAYKSLRDRSACLLVIAPRHVERGAAIAALATEMGLAGGRRSLGEDPARFAVYVADTLGEMGLWYSLARSALVGGSLLPGLRGHNPLEAARLGCPVLTGRHVENWPIVLEMAAAGALAMVDDDAGLTANFQAALDAPDPLVCRAAKARAFIDRRDGQTRAALRRIVDLLPP
ncbi:MAG: 3-deoxy-D-manno-octulosonic acid transferase, partial [Caulobacteraceae bacterium]